MRLQTWDGIKTEVVFLYTKKFLQIFNYCSDHAIDEIELRTIQNTVC